MTDFCPQAPLVVLVTNIRYVRVWFNLQLMWYVANFCTSYTFLLHTRMSRRTSWGRSSFGDSISRQPTTSQYSRQTFSPSNQYSASNQYSTKNQYSTSNQYSTNQIPQQSYTPQFSQKSSKFSRQSSSSNSISYNFPSNPNWKKKKYPSYADRCGSCKGEPRRQVHDHFTYLDGMCGSVETKIHSLHLHFQVCGSDGKTYENSCELENVSCRKYWDIRVVSMVSVITLMKMMR